MFTSIKDKIIRRIATSFLLKYVDGYKTEIMRVVHFINVMLLGLVSTCAVAGISFPQLTAACGVVGALNVKWVALGAFLSNLGLEFGIQDANAKERLGIPDPKLVSAKRV